MKKLRNAIYIGTALIFLLVGTNVFAGERYHKNSTVILLTGAKAFKNKQNNHQKKMNQRYKQRKKRYQEFQKRNRRHRHAQTYKYKKRGKRYHYSRHYNWNQWKRERNMIPKRYQGGHYHSDKGFLMFSFCDPDNDFCFSISLD